jgi:hypothetical protein
MKSRELRIGNYFKTDTGSETIIQASGIAAIENGFLKAEAIPLTEEWLLKFGFQEKDRRQNRFIKNDDFELEFQGDKVAYCVWGGEDAPHLTQFFGHCKHVHQLQNLYFALTGEELEIKL